MEPNHDIYRKEDLPRFKKRRRRSSSASQPSVGVPVPGPRPEPGPKDTRSMRIENWEPTLPQTNHHSRAGRHAERRSRLLWTVLIGIFAVYAVFLMISVVRGKKHVSAVVNQASATNQGQADIVATDLQVAVEIPFRISDKIANWNRVPDTLIDAQSLADQGQVQEAQSKLERALENTPRVSRLQIKLAQLLIQNKRYDKARSLLVDVLESNPEDTTARMMLARVLDHQTNYPASLAVAKWILETDPNSIDANEIAANAYLNTDRKGLAVSHLRKIVLIERDNPFAKNKLAMTYTQMGEHVKAIQLFSELLADNTADSMTYYNLAVCYAKMSDANQAVETLTRATSLFGRDFVRSWLQSPDFDNIRNERIFLALQSSDDSRGGTNAPAANLAPATNVPAAATVGTPP